MDVSDILVVLLADIFHKIRVRFQSGVSIQGKRLGIGSRVLDGSFPFDVPQVGAGRTLNSVQLFGARVTGEVDPELVVETDGVDHQRVALMLANRFTIPS